MYEDFQNLIYLFCGRKININKFRYPWEVTETSYQDFKSILEKIPNKKELEAYNRQHLMYVKQPMKLKEVVILEQLEDEGFTDPSELWSMGVQMVGIFRSIRTKARILNNEFFKQRGGKKSGYALRKEIVDDEVAASGKKITTLDVIKFNLLSLNQIPRLDDFNAESNFTLTIDLRGVKRDEKHYEYSFKSDGYKYLFPQSDKRR